MLDMTLIVLTYNEEENIKKCLKSCKDIVKKVVIVDSFSEDRTIEICKDMGAEIYQHKFTNHAEQFNWALENICIETEWILRLDADEELLPELVKEFEKKIPTLEKKINGVNLRRRVIFMGRWIKHGGIYPVVLLRVFRKGTAFYEDVNMNEHLILKEGKEITFYNDFIDNNLKSLSWWIRKQNAYSDKIVKDNIMHKTLKSNPNALKENLLGSQSERKRWIRNNIYDKLPRFFRGKMYFIYRYYIRLGFLDGKEGKIYHFFQGYMLSFITDAKMIEYFQNKK